MYDSAPEKKGAALRAYEWAEGVASGRIVSCARAVQASERFLRDLERADTDAFPYVLDQRRADHAVDFCESMRHVKGALGGQFLTLEGWQVFAIAQLFGWVHRDTGLRRFVNLNAYVPKKNGKSTFAAPIGLYCLAADGERGAEVYSAAGTSEQAGHVLNAARGMAESSPALRDLYGVKVERYQLRLEGDLVAVFKAAANQSKSKDGKNPHCAIFDEIHEIEDRATYDSITNAIGARSQPVIVTISTSGKSTASVGYEVYRYCCDVLSGVVEDEQTLALIFEADAGDDIGDPITWRKANPSLGAAKTLAAMELEHRKAISEPARLSDFKRKHLNLWTSAGRTPIDLGALRAAVDPDLTLDAMRGGGGIMALDLALTEDIASLACLQPCGDRFRLAFRHWLPERVIDRRGNEFLRGWVDAGWLSACPGGMIDLEAVRAEALEMYQAIGPAWFAYDPAFAAMLAAQLEGDGVRMLKCPQTPKFLDAPTRMIVEHANEGRIITAGDPVWLWACGNAEIRERGDFLKLTKSSATAKIDPVAAAIMAFKFLIEPVLDDDAQEGDYGRDGEIVVI